MRNLLLLDAYRVFVPGYPAGSADTGAFAISSATTGATLLVIASRAHGWDHVSVSTKNRCPNWPEMSRIKSLFFRDDECVMQLHVPTSDHVNNHPYCLHLWRPHEESIPRPPGILVGLTELSPDDVAAMGDRERLALQSAASDLLRSGAA